MRRDLHSTVSRLTFHVSRLGLRFAPPGCAGRAVFEGIAEVGEALAQGVGQGVLFCTAQVGAGADELVEEGGALTLDGGPVGEVGAEAG